MGVQAQAHQTMLHCVDAWCYNERQWSIWFYRLGMAMGRGTSSHRWTDETQWMLFPLWRYRYMAVLAVRQQVLWPMHVGSPLCSAPWRKRIIGESLKVARCSQPSPLIQKRPPGCEKYKKLNLFQLAGCTMFVHAVLDQLAGFVISFNSLLARTHNPPVLPGRVSDNMFICCP